ncbi:hypothetical protein F53441_7468 [Fusarium austroafricanum]|uniref:Uncharacterized protein n=1 Tax=Fusarium austroafricanum TaxID=2364996 RepID=A0A8H4KFI0_9HYPO|nr:hypothetical protein F53441_7468 [Fusarium austroafricanum]
MGGNKNRLYIALYPSGVVNNEERRYHWGFLIGPKDEAGDVVKGMRHHVKNHPARGWVYEAVSLTNVKNTNNLLARVMIAKIEDENRLAEIFRNTPVVQDDPNWRCRTWVAEVLSRIAGDGRAVGTAELDWGTIEAFARQYVGSKTAAGRYQSVEDAMLPKPTYDILQGKETIP